MRVSLFIIYKNLPFLAFCTGKQLPFRLCFVLEVYDIVSCMGEMRNALKILFGAPE
jgi:hypothetical protein